MKRYLVFMFYSFNPNGGGACDFKGDADNKKEIIKVIEKNYVKGTTENANIIDTKTGKIIEDFSIETDTMELDLEGVSNILDKEDIK